MKPIVAWRSYHADHSGIKGGNGVTWHTRKMTALCDPKREDSPVCPGGKGHERHGIHAWKEPPHTSGLLAKVILYGWVWPWQWTKGEGYTAQQAEIIELYWMAGETALLLEQE